jgi:DNA-binding transcriptional ArsR family regulator
MMPMAAVFEALAAPRRREILRLVWDRERSAGDIHRAFPDVTFGAVSQHLGVLEAAGLVARREEGRFRYYAARRRELGHLGKWLESMWDEALADLKRHAESEEKVVRRRGRHVHRKGEPS